MRPWLPREGAWAHSARNAAGQRQQGDRI